MAEVTWRPIEDHDLEAVVTAVDAASDADGLEERFSVDELVARLDAPGVERATDSRLGLGPGGDVRAWGLVETRGEPVELDRVWVWGGVHPDHRGRGLGRELLAWQVDRAGAVHRTTWPDRPGVAEATAPGGSSGHERLFARMGFSVLRWWLDLGQPLADLPPAPDPPDGLRFMPYAEVDDEAVRLAFNASWADHWGSRERDQEGWAKEMAGSSVFRPDLSSVAVAGDEVVALLLSERYPQDDEVRGHAEAWIGTLGTVREWRGRGVASGLIVRALHAYRAEGLDHAMIGVDADSLTGAAALYRGLGFVEEHRFASWAHPLD
ncbi:MAG TPA: GNAT family N-acetyltransferase [Iamia sp.]|nr:GNAT family N-acetyltransferase [Iamia sp.]